TVLARIPRDELESLFVGYGHRPLIVEGDDPSRMHQAMAAALDAAIAEIRRIQDEARSRDRVERPRWPMIILRTPKGWTGPKEVDGQKVEGSWRSHQVPLAELADRPEHVRELESWLKSYRPEELFDADGAPVAELRKLVPEGSKRMSATPY